MDSDLPNELVGELGLVVLVVGVNVAAVSVCTVVVPRSRHLYSLDLVSVLGTVLKEIKEAYHVN